MKIKYTGSSPARTLPMPDGRTIERGVPMDVADDIGAGLVKTNGWEEVGATKTAPKVKAKSKKGGDR